ncbi:hypothetical protein B0H66DRAFT_538944 [Apodospora peruviana]|uniref:Uncharacterized protein n=1 Tax=Apodospora peruviana TaxID=516989 RepID=A0AAE0HST8_9PEZI|nr:hypothetical protein B0H66DRAFT_538944 [Apodospora peruviana]
MHLFKNPVTAALALFFSVARSQIMVPGDLGDGMWEGVVNSTGGVEWTKTDDLPVRLRQRLAARGDYTTSAAPYVVGGGAAITAARGPEERATHSPSLLDRRDEVGCTGHDQDARAMDVLYRDFKRRCENSTIKGRTITLITFGDEFWYGCNYQKQSVHCNPDDVKIAYDSIKYRCGSGRSGWDHLDVPNFTTGIERFGYGTTTAVGY